MDTRSKDLINRVLDDITARRLKPGDEVGAAWAPAESRTFTQDRAVYTEALDWLTRAGVLAHGVWPARVADRLPAKPEPPA